MNQKDLIIHLYNRDCDPEEDDVLSIDDDVVTFPLRSTTGAVVGLHTYRPDAPKSNPKQPSQAKYFTHIPNRGNKHKPGVAYDVMSLDYKVPYVFLTEGIFDHFTIKRAGFNSLPALCNNPRHYRDLLFCLPFKYIIAVCEGDAAGDLLKRVSTHHMKLPYATDPNDLGASNMEVLLGEYLFDTLRF